MGPAKRTRRLGLFASFASAVWLSQAAPALGYVRTVNTAGVPVFWDRDHLELLVHVGDPPPGLTSRDVAEIATAAADAWNAGAAACSPMTLGLRFDLGADGPALDDNTPRITFRRHKWCREPRGPNEPCHSRAALAVTHVFSTADGHIRDADIEINAVDFAWRKPGAPQAGPPTQDLQYTLTHELGHLLGFEHSCGLGRAPLGLDDRGWPVPACASADEVARASVMYPTSRMDAGAAISEDDIRGLCALYRAAPTEVQAYPGGCAVGAKARPHGLALAAAALAMALNRRRSARSGSRQS